VKDQDHCIQLGVWLGDAVVEELGGMIGIRDGLGRVGW
jgi:hypothetical protein